MDNLNKTKEKLKEMVNIQMHLAEMYEECHHDDNYINLLRRNKTIIDNLIKQINEEESVANNR